MCRFPPGRPVCQARPSNRLFRRPAKPAERRRVGGKRAVLTVARKIGRRAYHVLRELETQAA